MNISIDDKVFEYMDVDQHDLNDFFNDFIQHVVNSGLDISTLVKIRFAHDYSEELTNFQQDNGLIVGHTDPKQGGFAKVEALINDSKLEHYIFIHFALLVNLTFENNEENQSLSLNTIYHELCHVQDGNVIYDLFGFESFRLENYLDSVLYQLSLSIWSEYYAHRKAMESFPIHTNLSDLKERLLEVEKNIKEQAMHNIEAIYQKIHKYIEWLVRDIGNYHGAKLDEREIYNGIEETILYKHFYGISHMLDKLYNEYPYWDSYEVLYDFTLIIQTIWKDLGFNITKIKDSFILSRNDN